MESASAPGDPQSFPTSKQEVEALRLWALSPSVWESCSQVLARGKGSVRYDPDNDIVFGEYTPRMLTTFFERFAKYNTTSYRYPNKIAERCFLASGGDNEGLTFSKSKTLYRRVDSSDSLIASLWEVHVRWEEVQGDDFDFISIERQDRSTAYKARAAGPPREVKFKLVGASIPNTYRETKTAAAREIPVLDQLYRELDELSATLVRWVASGHGGWVGCRNRHCYRQPSFVDHAALQKLSDQGLSLEEVKNQLVCTRCGQREAVLKPMPASLDGQREGADG